MVKKKKLQKNQIEEPNFFKKKVGEIQIGGDSLLSFSISRKARLSRPSPAIEPAAPASEPSQDPPSSPWHSFGQGSSNSPLVTKVERFENVARASIPDEVLNQTQPLWANYVVGHFVGEDAPHIGIVHATVNRI